MFELAVTPEIRATFLQVTPSGGMFIPGFAGANTTAYTLPCLATPLLTLSKAKETKEKEKDKEANKDSKDIKDRKQNLPDKYQPDRFPEVEAQTGAANRAPGLADLAQRLATIEELLATGKSFIPATARPKVG